MLGIRVLIILNQTLECVTLNILVLKSFDPSLESAATEVYGVLLAKIVLGYAYACLYVGLGIQEHCKLYG